MRDRKPFEAIRDHRLQFSQSGPEVVVVVEQRAVGRLPNEPDELLRRLLDPRSLELGTGMSDLNLTARKAHDLVASVRAVARRSDDRDGRPTAQSTRERRTQNSLPSGSARTTHDASP
jgi:hypothetical protein